MVELQIINKIVIPANAGVILANDELKHAGYRYPRECGGDPETLGENIVQEALSPRMRG